LYDIQWGDLAIEGGLKAILSNSIASTIPKWWTLKTSEVDARLASVNIGTKQFCMVIDLGGKARRKETTGKTKV
jgi:hypothetical protein